LGPQHNAKPNIINKNISKLLLRRKINEGDQVSGRTKRMRIDVNKRMQKFINTDLDFIH
jgi:hypothetical protein